MSPLEIFLLGVISGVVIGASLFRPPNIHTH